MHQRHPVFAEPTNTEVPIWRYIDLPKLVSLLTSSTLWFSRADLLGDPHEGSYGPFNVAKRSEAYQRFGMEETVLQKMLDEFPRATRRMVKYTYASCWHMNEAESVAMWRAYAGEGQAVAVRSSYQRLCDSIDDERSVFVGLVNYVDPTATWIPEGNTLYPYVHKRASFAYERELRAVVQDFPAEGTWGAKTPPGLPIAVNLPTLIERIYVGPQQQSWFLEAVTSVASAFAPGVEVQQSDLDTDPVY